MVALGLEGFLDVFVVEVVELFSEGGGALRVRVLRPPIITARILAPPTGQ